MRDLNPASQNHDEECLTDLVASAIEQLHDGGPSQLEAFLLEHPEDAVGIRRHLQLIDGAGMLAPPDVAADRIPERLGEFEIIERLGGGGMGVVYLANQPSLGRQVALKVVRPEHLYFPSARERFRREVQAVAKLQHPHIVRVFSVGEEDGVPYFAMEQIQGVSLDRLLVHLGAKDPTTLHESDVYRALRELGGEDHVPAEPSLPRRWIEIVCVWMRELSDAVDFAHGHDVLHRDIKPSNVMITWSMDAMLLDFGLARSESSDNAGDEESRANLTRSGAQLGSVPYMAPEQVRGENDRVDCRTDVYALGVLFYEMLTLSNPFQEGSSSDEETKQRITVAAVPATRQLNHAVTWDVETVCRCAMAPEPERRYASAGALRDDCQNLLDLQPIAAKRPHAGVRLRRYVRRHPARSVAMAMGTLLLVVGPSVFAITEYQLRKDIVAARDEAVAEAETRADILKFFNDELLAAVSPSRAGKDATLREVLDLSAETLDGRFDERPLVEAAIRSTLSKTYKDLGEFDAGIAHAERSLALHREHAGAGHRDTLTAERYLASALAGGQRFEEAEQVGRTNLASCKAEFGPKDPDTLTAVNNLGLTLSRLGKYKESEELLRELVETRIELLGEDDETTQTSMNNLGLVLYGTQRFEEAEAWAGRVLALRRASHGKEDPLTLTYRSNFINILSRQFRFEEAAPLYDPLIADMRKVFGDAHRKTVNALMSSAANLSKQKNYAEAAKRFDESLIAAKAMAPESQLVFSTELSRAANLSRAGRFEEAAAAFDDLIPRCTEAMGAKAHLTLTARVYRAGALSKAGEIGLAEQEYADLLADGSGLKLHEFPPCRIARAINLQKLEQYQAAVETLVAALKQLQAENRGRAMQGHIYRKLVAVTQAAGMEEAHAQWQEALLAWDAKAGAKSQ